MALCSCKIHKSTLLLSWKKFNSSKACCLFRLDLSARNALRSSFLFLRFLRCKKARVLRPRHSSWSGLNRSCWEMLVKCYKSLRCSGGIRQLVRRVSAQTWMNWTFLCVRVTLFPAGRGLPRHCWVLGTLLRWQRACWVSAAERGSSVRWAWAPGTPSAASPGRSSPPSPAATARYLQNRERGVGGGIRDGIQNWGSILDTQWKCLSFLYTY